MKRKERKKSPYKNALVLAMMECHPRSMTMKPRTERRTNRKSWQKEIDNERI